MKTCIICGTELTSNRRKLCGSQDCQNAYNAIKQRKYRERSGRRNRNAGALLIESNKLNLTSPPVRYYGGKWRIASWILEQFPPHLTYVEPFCGAANILFRKQPSKIEVINDLNSNIITFFDVLRSRPDDLIHAIQLTPYSRAEHRRAHEDVSDDYPDRSLEIARRFYVRSRQSFGSGEGEYSTGWRYESNGKRGTSVTDEWNSTRNLWIAAERLKSVQIESDDAIRTIERFDTPDTLFYVDPPYPMDTRYSDEHRYAHEMTNSDHRHLAATLRAVEGMVLISSYKSNLYDELYDDWRCIQKDTRTNGNNDATEYLWISPKADDLSRLPLFQGMA